MLNRVVEIKTHTMSQLKENQVIELAEYQFKAIHNNKNAFEEIQTASNSAKVFAPDFHGPRNVPINASISQDDDSNSKFTHFPIVESGVYYLCMDFDKTLGMPKFMYNKFGVHIPLVQVKSPQDYFKMIFKTKSEVMFTSDAPQPVAIKFNIKNADSKALKYIVVKEFK